MDFPTAWLYRVAMNLSNSHFRRRAAEGRAKERVAALDTGSSVSFSDGTDAIALRDALAKLPRRQRSALVLRYYGGFSVNETAELMQCPPSTVKTLARRALQRLGSQELSDDAVEVGDAG